MSTEKLRLAIGTSNFVVFRQPGVLYIDKSDLIRKVIEDPAEAILLPRPRRFGKTTNMSMLRAFFEKGEGDATPLFQDLSIWHDEGARAHFGRHPVIFLSFKDVKASSWETAFALLKQEIQRAFAAHSYLLEGLQLAESTVARFKQVLSEKGEPTLYMGALRELCGLLHQYHGEQVILLLDEYDTPIHAAFAAGFYPQAVEFLRGLLSGALKDNTALFKAVLTGILRVAKEGIFSGLNNLGVYTLLHPRYATDFGFTEGEIDYLLSHARTAATAEELRAWYNGYAFGGQVVYNPWSVLWAVSNGEVGPYWVNTSGTELIRELLFGGGSAVGDDLDRLLSGQDLRVPVLDAMVLPDMSRHPEALWSFLLFTGYLSASGVRLEDDGVRRMTVCIPNREVKIIFQTIFRDWLSAGLGGAREVEALLAALLAGDAAGVEARLGRLLVESASFLDASDRPVAMTPEQVYHAFVLGLLVHLQPRYLVRSNRESGHGRYDVMLEPREPGKPGVVLELKTKKRGETAASVSARAIQQIGENDYAVELRARGAQPIHEMAVVFDGKRVHVALRGAAPVGAPRRSRRAPKRKATPKRR